MERNSKSAMKLSKSSSFNNQIPKTKFNVVIRIRPAEVGTEYDSDRFTKDDLVKVVYKLNEKQLRVKKPHTDDRIYCYDHILKDSTTQEQAYNIIAKNIVEDITNGYNGTIMAYGQTGSGKTYTIFGKQDSMNFTEGNNLDVNAGIIPRAIKRLFNYLRKSSKENEGKKKKFKISASFFQIYMEHITDLIPDLNSEDEPQQIKPSGNSFNLNSNVNNISSNKIRSQAKKDAGEGLKIREDPKTGVFIKDLKQVTVENEEQLLGLINYSSQNRITTNTNMNQTSSRSHAILRILLEQREYGKEERKTLSGLLTIVDLAGSEKSKLSSDGIRFEETKFINSSLYQLGSVISCLANNPKEASFRSSNLTRILQDCLSGNSKTSICATISPFLLNYDETLTTLQFANRAIKISNLTSVNEKIEIKALKESVQKIINQSQPNMLLHENTIQNILQKLNYSSRKLRSK